LKYKWDVLLLSNKTVTILDNATHSAT